MRFLTLPLATRRRLIEHETDILTPAAAQRSQTYGAPCPRCKGAMHMAMADQPFTHGSVLPRNVARCVDCGCEIDTQSGMMIKMGNPAKVESPIPIIDPNKKD